MPGFIHNLTKSSNAHSPPPLNPKPLTPCFYSYVCFLISYYYTHLLLCVDFEKISNTCIYLLLRLFFSFSSTLEKSFSMMLILVSGLFSVPVWAGNITYVTPNNIFFHFHILYLLTLLASFNNTSPLCLYFAFVAVSLQTSLLLKQPLIFWMQTRINS